MISDHSSVIFSNAHVFFFFHKHMFTVSPTKILTIHLQMVGRNNSRFHTKHLRAYDEKTP